MKSEKEMLYNITADIWNLLKNHIADNDNMNDDEWTAYVNDVTKLGRKYESNRVYLDLFEDFCNLIEKYELKKEGKLNE